MGNGQFLRLLKIDALIREQKFPSIKRLAAEFEVSSRTIERDIEFLKDRYNAPIQYDPQNRGYIYTQETFFLKSVFLTADEFFSVAIFERALRQYRNTPIEAQLKFVFKKLASALPSNVVSINTALLDESVTFVTDAIPEIDNETFAVIFKGVKACRTIRFMYRGLKQKKPHVRVVNPYHIVCQRGVWYVLGLCHEKKDIRIFSFSRMTALTLVEGGRFTVPADFNAELYVDKNVGVWASQRHVYTVRLLFRPDVAVFASERIWADELERKVHADKSFEVAFSTTQISEIKRFVLGQGASVTVLEPQELIAEIQKEITAMQVIYGRGRA